MMPDCLLDAGVMQMPIVRASGIYFLCQGDVVVYVGKTINLLLRLGQHVATDKYDAIYYVLAPADQLIDLEASFIRKLRPQKNKLTRIIHGVTVRVSSKHAPKKIVENIA